MSSDRWLTYSDAAALLGMTVDSLRHKARRECWGKRLGNEGKALVLVPLDALPPAGDAPGGMGGDPPGDAPAVRPAKRPASPPEHDAVAMHLARIADLEQRIAELRRDLDTARQDRDRERDERQVERDRADRVTAEIAEIAKQFAALTASATAGAQARETALEARIEAMRAEAALRDRPWWRRLAA